MVIAPPRKPLSLIRMPQARGSLHQWVAIRCENWMVFFNTIFKKYRPQAAQINRRLWYLHLPDSGSSVINNSFTSSVYVNRLVLPALVLNKHEYMAGKQHGSTCCFTNLFTKLVTVPPLGLPANTPPASVEPGKKDKALQSLITDAINPLMLHRTAGPFSRVGSNTSVNQFAGLHRRDIKRIAQWPTKRSSLWAVPHLKRQWPYSQETRKKPGLDPRKTTVGRFIGESLRDTTRVIHTDNIHTKPDSASGRINSTQAFPHLKQAFSGALYEKKLQSLKVVNAEKKAPQLVFSNDQQTHARSYYPDAYEKDKVVNQPATDDAKTEFGSVKVGLLTPVQKTYLYQDYMTTRRDIRNINLSWETRVNSLAQSKSFGRTSPTSSYSVLSHILTHKREKQHTLNFPESAYKIYFRPPTVSLERGSARSSSYAETNGNLIHFSKRRPIGSETTSRVHPTTKETKTNTVVETYTAPTLPPISAPNIAGGAEVQVRRLANQVYDLIVERVRRERLLRGH
jgi:hypothetical protein